MKTHLSFWLGAALLIGTLAGCDQEDETTDPTPTPTPTPTSGTVEVNFRAAWGDQPFAIGTTYSDPDNRPMLVETFKAYLSDVSLIKTDGTPVLIEDIDLVNFNNGATYSQTIPNGEYIGIRFGIGVPAELNTGQDPAQYPSSHPLSVEASESMFWTWNSGYIFSKFEGKVALDNDPNNMIHPYAFHIGTDNFYLDIELAHSFTVAGNTTAVDVVFDASSFLTGADDTIDLATDNITHTMGNMPLANRFNALFGNSIRVE
jgi:hypothetical protein